MVDIGPETPGAKSIRLWQDSEPDGQRADGFRPWLDPYPVASSAPLGTVLVCPGGGYGGRARHEGILVAQRFNVAGFNAFVVHYSVAPNRHPAPIRDVSRAIRMIRKNAAKWNVASDRVAVCGFSAGGHLAASLGVHFDRDYLRETGEYADVPNRPDASILCYPVITWGPHGHQGSFNNLLGSDASEEQRATMSLEKQVTDRTPPAFLWHTFEDQAVPVENSILFAQALRSRGVPLELHVYPKGQHGLGLSPGDKHVASWMPLCCEWLQTMGWPSTKTRS